jgi:uncharacterized metal-binding protein YceD (DUF177 family)
MGKSIEFIVPFSGLKLGKHKFEFLVDDSFFEKLDYSPIKKGEVTVNLELDKKPAMLTLNFKLGGWIGENCDRCAVDYHQKLEGEYQIFVKFGEEYDEPDENLIILPHEAFEINVTQLIYEFIGLSIPLKKVPCEEDGDTSICDLETLKALENSESEEEKENPLWAELNKIKDQLKD